MSCLWSKSVVYLAVLLLVSLPTFAEVPRPIESPVIPQLSSLARKSGYIFSGTVKAVERVTPASASSVAVMRITFQVEKGYVGVRSGQELVIQECAGLWQSGESYRRGEKVLLFLYPPSKLGLTSPVRGMGGRFAVDPGGGIIVQPDRGSIEPLRRPLPLRESPKGTRVRPEDFARALHAALKE